MKVRKRAMSTALIAALVFGSLVFTNTRVDADSIMPVMIVVNGRELPPQIPVCVNFDGIPYVYFETLAEALGGNMEASVWENTTKRMTIAVGDKLLILQIGSPAISIATIKNGEIGDIQNYIMPVEPIIIDDYAVVPVEFVVNALGGAFIWNPSANMGTVNYTKPVTTTPAPAPVITPAPYVPPVQQTVAPPPAPVVAPVTPVPTATPVTRNPVFMDTTYFQLIGGKRAQDMWDYDNSFALVVFSGQDANSVARLPAIKEAAATSGYKIYGVDVSSTEFTGINSLTWVYNYIDMNSPNFPRLLYTYKGDPKAYEIADVTKKDTIVSSLNALKNNQKPTPVPTATPTPTATPYYAYVTPTPTGWTGGNTYAISKSDAINKYNNREKFFYLYYNTHLDSNSGGYLSTLTQAAQAAGVTVFMTDFRSEEYTNWFGSYPFNNGPPDNPTLYAVNGGSIYDITVYVSDYNGVLTFLTNNK